MNAMNNNYSIEPIPFISSSLQYLPQERTFKQIRRELKSKVKSILQFTPQAKMKSKLKKYDRRGAVSGVARMNC